MSSSYCLVYKEFSLGKYYAKPKAPLVLGIIVNFNNGSAPSKNQATTPWPLSCTATVFSYISDTSIFFSNPPITLSTAISKFSFVTNSLSYLIA